MRSPARTNLWLDEALTLARRGTPIFPCRADKSPLTLHGFKDATTNRDLIREWWMRWPEALIGAPTRHQVRRPRHRLRKAHRCGEVV
jgi:hypothetical protein